MIARLVPIGAALLSASLLCAGCGGSDSGADLAGLAPPASLLYVEATVKPEGELKGDVDAAAARLGVEDLGETIVSALEDSSDGDGDVDFEKNVEPWLGERAAVFFRRYDGEDFAGGGAIVSTTDPAATQDFIDEEAREADGRVKRGSYEGVDYTVDPDGGQTRGIVGDYAVFAEDEAAFEAAVDAAEGESLAGVAEFEGLIDAAPAGSVADVYVDVGALVERSGGEIDPTALDLLRGTGIAIGEASALASVIPGEDRIEVELSSELAGEEAPSGDASELLGSLPAESFAAIAISGFGDQLEEAIDELDEEGVGETVPPGELKSGLKQAGIDLDRIAAALRDAAIFAAGRNEGSLTGALVLSTEEGGEATETVASLGRLLRSAGAPGVTAVTGRASGFSVRSEEIGDKPLVVVAKGDRVAIGYGRAAALTGVLGGAKATLSGTAAYGEAVAALGEVPIAGYADGPAALRLADSLVPASESGFEDAKPYLRKIAWLALGSASEGDVATAKLIAGLR